MKHSILAGACALALTLCGAPADAQSVTTAAGWIYSNQTIGDLVQSCVQSGPAGTFVGIGPGFTGGGQSVLFVDEAGGETLVVGGLNSIGDCVYDAATDTLYITDNALEAAGSTTGDTVYEIPAASTATGLAAEDHELLPAGSIASASSIAIDAAGDLYITDSTGAGAGNVRKISGGVMTPFASGFEFTGGIAVDALGDVYVADSLPSFESQISRFDTSGTFLGVVSGPTFGHGSYDLVFDADGQLIVTGLFIGDVVKVDTTDGSQSLLATGLTFATGAERSEFTGRVQVLSSTFVPEIEDLRIHKFVSIDKLVAGKGSQKTECMSEFYGVELVPVKPGKKAKLAICEDGAACDSDGLVNDVCTYPLGLCLNVDDILYPKCSATQVSSVALKKAKPASAALDTVIASIAVAIPVTQPGCFFSTGFEVPVKIKKNGTKKHGQGMVKIAVERDDAKPSKDVDVLTMRCLPAAL